MKVAVVLIKKNECYLIGSKYYYETKVWKLIIEFPLKWNIYINIGREKFKI